MFPKRFWALWWQRLGFTVVVVAQCVRIYAWLLKNVSWMSIQIYIKANVYLVRTYYVQDIVLSLEIIKFYFLLQRNL